MARVLADGTGAEWAQVWFVVNGRLRLAATWPSAPTPDPSPVSTAGPPPRRPTTRGGVRRSRPVLRPKLLGRSSSASGSTDRSRRSRPDSSQASRTRPDRCSGVGLHAELNQRLDELSVRAEELRTSRQRLVAAQDAERRTLERNIHDGAQQHLVALAVNLRLAETLSRRSRERADGLLAEQERAAAEAIDVLVALSRGIYPAKLGADGLVPPSPRPSPRA